MGENNRNIADLLVESTLVEEKEIPFIIEQLSSMDVNPNAVDAKVLLEDEPDNTGDGDGGGVEEAEMDTDVDRFVEGYVGDSSLKMYLRDVAELSKQYKMLSREEELDLARKAQNGNTYAREKLINSNLRLVIYNAKKFSYRGVPLEELIQEGNIGLCMAADKFDYTKNFRFSTYATWWILQRIRKSVVTKDGIIRVPPHIVYKTKRITQAQEEYIEKHGKAPTKEELAEICELPLRTVETVLNTPTCNTTLDSKLDSDSETSLVDVLTDKNERSIEDQLDLKVLREKLEKSMDTLDERERYVIWNRFFNNMSLQAIGDDLGGLCRERIRQIQNEALAKMSFDPEVFGFLDK